MICADLCLFVGSVRSLRLRVLSNGRRLAQDVRTVRQHFHMAATKAGPPAETPPAWLWPCTAGSAPAP